MLHLKVCFVNSKTANLHQFCLYVNLFPMLKIRLQRVGRKNINTFRVVITDSKNSAKSGRSLEVLGFHDPINNKTEVDAEKIKYWISKGAQLSDNLHNLFINKKIITGKKINILPLKSKTVSRKEAKANKASAKLGTPATPPAPKTEAPQPATPTTPEAPKA